MRVLASGPRSAATRPGAPTRVLLLLSIVLAGLALATFAFALPVAAESPSASASTIPAATGSPVASPEAPQGAVAPAGTASPCPHPAPGPNATPNPHQPLCPAEPKGADPFSLLAWLFTPIFQTLFLGLMLAYRVLGDIGLAIIALTLVIRLLLVPVFKRQIVSQRRMQQLQPELKIIQQRFKGDRAKTSEETMRLYRERGVSPASGCLPALLQFGFLIPMYSVFNQGLLASDISSMLQVFGVKVLEVPCYRPGDPAAGCIDPHVGWLGGLDASRPEVTLNTGLHFLSFPVALSVLALISALLQLVQTRMSMTRSDDPATRSQQRIFLVLPLFSLVYGAILPAGLFIYWIVTTIFSIVQQYMIAGWGGMFPLFGRTPAFAVGHTPRFPITAVAPLAPRNADNGPPPTRRTASDRAAGTIRPARAGGRTSRRGRRR